MELKFGDFTSLDVFSGLLSLFAAVISLAYPFILQVRERIQSRYVLEKVVDWFQQEPYLRRFLKLLRINIPIALLNPFLLYLFRQNESLSITLLTAQSIFVCVLLFYLMRLYQLINIYGSYREMAIHTSAEDMERLAIVMLSADHRNEEEGYFTAKDKLYRRMTETLIKEAQKRDGKIVDFPEEVIQIIRKIFYAAEKKRMFPRTSVDTTLIPLLYDAIYNKTHVTKELRKFIWLHLNRLLRAGNTDWLKSYWEWSSQFYRAMRYDNNYNESERKRFFEMHSFFAAMVLRSNNMELMKYIMTFQDASPEPPCLLLQNSTEIIKMLFHFDRLRNCPFKLAELYQMFFFTNDVNADNNIYRVLCDYLAFSLVYQEANKGKYICFGEYHIDDSLSKEELEHDKSVLEWFRETVLTDVRKSHWQFFRKELFSAANVLLIQIIESYIQKIANVDETDVISQDKLQAMKDDILNKNKEIKLPLLKKVMLGDNVEKLEFMTKSVAQASPGQLLEKHNISCANFADALISNMRRQFYARLASLFLLNGSVCTYLIQYKDLQSALKKICFNNDEYTILNNGVSLWNYALENIATKDIVNIGSDKNNLFIVKKDDCPTYMHGTLKCLNSNVNSEDANISNVYTVLDAENGLYWKGPTKANNLLIEVAQPFVIYNRRHMRYIKINITYDRAIGDCDLNKLKDLRKIL